MLFASAMISALAPTTERLIDVVPDTLCENVINRNIVKHKSKDAYIAALILKHNHNFG